MTRYRHVRVTCHLSSRVLYHTLGAVSPPPPSSPTSSKMQYPALGAVSNHTPSPHLSSRVPYPALGAVPCCVHRSVRHQHPLVLLGARGAADHVGGLCQFTLQLLEQLRQLLHSLPHAVLPQHASVVLGPLHLEEKEGAGGLYYVLLHFTISFIFIKYHSFSLQ